MRSISDLANLSGRTALVTGAAGHIGMEICATLGELGSDLILVDRPEANFDRVLTVLAEYKDIQVTCIQCDLEQHQERIKLIKRVLKEKHNIGILINNAAFVGTSDLRGLVDSFTMQSIETWRRVMELNVGAVFDLCQGLEKPLREAGHGSIVNVSSIYGMKGPDYSLYKDLSMGNSAAYATSKGGLTQLSRWLATTLAPDVRVNTLTSGGIQRGQSPEFVRRYAEKTPLKRLGREEDLKGAIAYLTSDLSNYVTGQNLIIDGGWTVW